MPENNNQQQQRADLLVCNGFLLTHRGATYVDILTGLNNYRWCMYLSAD